MRHPQQASQGVDNRLLPGTVCLVHGFCGGDIGVAVRAGHFVRMDVLQTTPTQRQLRWNTSFVRRFLALVCPGQFDHLAAVADAADRLAGIDAFGDQVKTSDGEGRLGRVFEFDDALAQPAFLQVQRAVMAVGVVAGFAEQGVRGSGAAATADVVVVTASAVTPQVVDTAQAAKVHAFAVVPDIVQAHVANVAARKPHGCQ